MSTTSPAPPRPAFVIGITGNMDPDFSKEANEDTLRSWLRTLFLFLRFGASAPASGSATLFQELHDLSPCPDSMLKGLEDWPGTGENTELILLSSLAPGADTLAVDVFLEMCEVVEGFSGRVRVPLPFPETIYAGASTFQRAPSPEEGQKDAKDVFLDRIAKIKEAGGDSFQVYLRSDVKEEEALSNPERFESRCEEDVNLKERRHLRYQAAGEYVATFSDVLIAIDDDRKSSGSSAGAHQIVEAKRRGATPYLLPFTDAFTWSDNGPIFHLFFPRQRNQSLSMSYAELDKTPLRILHPYEHGPADDKDRATLAMCPGPQCELTIKAAIDEEHGKRLEKDYEKWQESGNRLFSRTVRNLAQFNREQEHSKEAVELYKMAGLSPRSKGDEKDSDPRPEELAEELRTSLCDGLSSATEEEKDACAVSDPMPFLQRLDALARIRKRASEKANAHQKSVETILSSLFILSFIAAVLLHVFAHWHPLKKQYYFKDWLISDPDHATQLGPKLKPIQKADPDVDGNDKEIEKKPFFTTRSVIGMSSIFFAGGGLILFLSFMSQRKEEKFHDYRALAEAGRIQIYWCMAGLRRSAAGNYMQRVRSEMDWIRNSISSLHFPAERWQKEFFELDEKIQVRLLRRVIHEWVGNPSDQSPKEIGQMHYYKRSAEKNSEALHLRHALGSSLALAGLFLILCLIGFVINKPAMLDEWLAWGFMWTIPTGILLLGACSLCLFLIRKKASLSGHHHHPSHAKGVWKIVASLFPHHENSARSKFSRIGRLLTAIGNFSLLLPTTFSFAFIGYGLAFLPSRWCLGAPGPLDTGIIIIGTFLLGGALLVALAEKRLYSEHAYQYNAAARLFATARPKLETYLSQMEGTLKDLTNEQNRKDFEKAREHIHQLLFALGKEALDENSEWLILHRARPMEPVMAG